MTSEHNIAPIALVTGAGSGIGRAVALQLADAGYHVVLVGRSIEKLRETVAASDDKSRFYLHPADVSDQQQVGHLFEEIKRRFGRLDLLFNNAGISVPATSVEDVGLDDWHNTLAVNVTAVFLCTQLAVRMMKTQRPAGGRIINNGSISAHSPRPGSVAYTASKHAVTGITKSTNLDCRQFGIACGQIDIGNAETPMAERMKAGVPQANGQLAPEPTIDPAAVAQAVLYMASLPLDANVPFMTVMANQMPYIGRG